MPRITVVPAGNALLVNGVALDQVGLATPQWNDFSVANLRLGVMLDLGSPVSCEAGRSGCESRDTT